MYKEFIWQNMNVSCLRWYTETAMLKWEAGEFISSLKKMDWAQQLKASALSYYGHPSKIDCTKCFIANSILVTSGSENERVQAQDAYFPNNTVGT